MSTASQQGRGALTDRQRVAYNFAAGGVAGIVARTVIAPIERIKIIYQIRVTANEKGPSTGWVTLLRKVVNEGGGGMRGVAAFWKGNSIAVIRVFPYLGVQLASNEYFRKSLDATFSMSREMRNFFAGGSAGLTAVLATYPLDLARARMALLMEQGASNLSMSGTIREVYAKEGGGMPGIRALYSGAGISMTGAAFYCGVKFASYDMSKNLCRQYLLPDPDGPPSALHRAVSGCLAGVFAQMLVYPFDVLRRRLQTGGAAAKEKYPDTVRGLWRLYSDEGLARGLYRGCTLNLLKTVPNTTVYLALFDLLRDLVH